MNYHADLHLHSHLSRATSKKLSLHNIAAWASIKGMHLVGTSDFTHPKWLASIEEHLTETENGFLSFKNNMQNLQAEIPNYNKTLQNKTQFILQTEISSIYKKNDRVRKIHSLVYLSSIEAVKKFNAKLAKIGNLQADGRPILGLDVKELLRMVLETDEKGFLIPAHIWTPWFALFGEKSGFDSLSECFEDLSDEIFAVETGLSTSPSMNWTLSALDNLTLIANSDAHSGEKIAREYNVFSGEFSYLGLRDALKNNVGENKLVKTCESYPELGKYFLCGHRNCGISLSPQEVVKENFICPVCGKALTMGTQNRIYALADRDKPIQSAKHAPYTSFVPLKELLAEIFQVGIGSKKVHTLYISLLQKFPSENAILFDIPLKEFEVFHEKLPLALKDMREKKIRITEGYDGVFGKIHLF